ncbi:MULTISPECIES: hypothetical protein [Calothrix]|uniref:Uncharacterized protein n=2 Tax=Calothrix TaxID=1186 RepID=A0ABR8A4D4_9CYAN|nr:MULTISPECIES: hypothetical protein [Calothrix]MBD2194761.1 hypothetical protein [Calothrix parietina FACHB-288]MBD2225089.1 hypothetical protein [Calothrix anomala FACHB-343]
MGLAQTQQVLAQLYTNSQLRQRFFANPQSVGAELGLTEPQIQELAAISSEQVNMFANSLKWKRLGEVRELLPGTAKVLGKNFNDLFWRYAETYIPQGIKKHRLDAIAFANFIQTQKIEPVWVRDLLRYEKTWLLAYDSPRCLRVCWFLYPVDKLGTTEKISRQLTLAVWWRLNERSRLHHTLRWWPIP